MRLRIAVVLAVLVAALLVPGLARAEDGQSSSDATYSVQVVASANGFADGNGSPSGGASTDGFSDGNSSATTGASGADSADVIPSFGMSDGNG